ncbi:MAG: hypothetical protein IPI98_02580 [Chitinophagaceae bacterium]|nr:hypothetical protein [Chitinophagaceae bacterium]
MQYELISENDSLRDIAEKIYSKFISGQSCTISGFCEDLNGGGKREVVPRGEVVIRLLEIKYRAEFYDGNKRRLKYIKNSVGGPVAHKIFKYEKHIRESIPVITIWRMQ